MRIGIVACDILKNEIEFLTGNDPDFVHREYLEFALHENPEAMKQTIIERVNSLKGSVDTVFLGYGTCQSLEGITDVLEVPTVMLSGADCIDVLLGAQEYAAEKRFCAGTWFSSPGWAEQGIDGLVKEFHLDSVEGVDYSFFLNLLFESYERCLFIDTGIGKRDYFEEKSQCVADELKLKHDCRKCDLRYIQQTIDKTKELCKRI